MVEDRGTIDDYSIRCLSIAQLKARNVTKGFLWYNGLLYWIWWLVVYTAQEIQNEAVGA